MKRFENPFLNMSKEEFLAVLDEAGFEYEEVSGPGEVVLDNSELNATVRAKKNAAGTVIHRYASATELDFEYKNVMDKNDFYKERGCKNVSVTYTDVA